MDSRALEQYRLLENADGGKRRAEAELIRERESSRNLKKHCTATENRNAELSDKNKSLASKVTFLENQREQDKIRHGEQIAGLVEAKDAAESLHDEATNERKTAFAERDTANTNAKVHKDYADQAVLMIEQAVADKEEKHREVEALQKEVSELRTEMDRLRSDLESNPAAGVSAVDDVQLGLGLAGPSSQ